MKEMLNNQFDSAYSFMRTLQRLNIAEKLPVSLWPWGVRDDLHDRVHGFIRRIYLSILKKNKEERAILKRISRQIYRIFLGEERINYQSRLRSHLLNLTQELFLLKNKSLYPYIYLIDSS
ncbi:hypothetical protein UFOVP53_116 [uncultured Caudovirales phage]|uniref:Uncharacterized protein n=1 Tax=uncultured Caudovirales phage TaxID=2100421 RepID=A0A6J5KZ15_9CAUD|nr:hypothetical protein UFOVP53_116 [uncultured Caudovirales phage]